VIKPRIIAVDFDGTLVTHEYPKVGIEVPGAVKVVGELIEAGHRIILWTMRHDQGLIDAHNWMIAHNIPPWAINHNPEQSSWTDSNKAYANLYIDDAACGCPLIEPWFSACCSVLPKSDRPYVNWSKVEALLRNNNYL
jgi:hypothetical protein